MHKVDYCARRLVRTGLLLLGAALLSLYLLRDGGLMWLVTPVLLAAGSLAGLKLFGDRSALLWDERGISVITLTGRKSVVWREIIDIDAERMTQYVLGFIPVASVDFIAIKTRGGLFASKLRIASGLLDLPPGGTAELVVTLKRALAAATGGAAVPAAPVQSRPQLVAESASGSDSGFDPDAAIARYLAQKAAGAGPAETVPAAAAMPVRPVFGRKAV